MAPLVENACCGSEHQQSVTFSDSVQTWLIPPLYDLTDNELNSMYYSVDEIEAIRRHARITLDLSESDLEFDQEHFCHRGVWTKQEKVRRSIAILGAIEAVLMEQHLQREEKIVDVELLADVYFESTRDSQLEALVRGRMDEEAIRDYYHEDVRLQPAENFTLKQRMETFCCKPQSYDEKTKSPIRFNDSFNLCNSPEKRKQMTAALQLTMEDESRINDDEETHVYLTWYRNPLPRLVRVSDE